MSQEPRNVSLQEYVAANRAQIIVLYDNAKEIALRHFDDLANKLAEIAQQAQKAQQEQQNANTTTSTTDSEEKKDKKNKKD